MGKRLLVAVAAIFAIMSVGFAVLASTPTPAIESVEASSDFESVTVTFNVDVFTDVEEGAGVGTLATDDFDVAGLPPGVTLDSVTADGPGAQRWRLAFTGGSATANTTEIRTVADAIHTTGGDPIPVLSHVVPLTAADVATLLTGLVGVQLPLADLGAIPFVGEWLANPGPPDAEGVVEARSRSLADLAPDLTAALADLAGQTQAEVEAALENLDVVSAVDFGSDRIDISFDDQASAGSFTADQATTLAPLGLEIDAALSADVALGGGLAVAVGASGAVVDTAASSLELAVRLDADADLAARLGFVDVEVVGATVNAAATATLALGCPEGDACATGALTAAPTLDGSVNLTVGRIQVTGFSQSLDFDLADAVVATWDLSGWDLADWDSETNDYPQAPTINADGLAAFQAVDLHHFNTADFRALLLGLDWVANWMLTLDEHDAMSTELPLVGRSPGDLLRLAELVGTEVDALLEAVADADGTPSAQQAVRLLCETAWVDGADCDTLLAPLNITTDSITYDIDLAVDRDLFGDSPPELNLSLTDELEGVSVTARAGTWSESSASASLSFTLGIKLTPDDELASELNLDPDDVYSTAGVPQQHTLVDGELCAGLAGLVGSNVNLLLDANGLLTNDAALSECDQLVAAGTTVDLPGDGGDRSVSADDVCEIAASVWQIPVADFRSHNSAANNTQCAAAVSPGATLYYVDPAADLSPVRLAHRVYIAPTDSDFVDLSLTVKGTGVGADVTLGFLDLGLDGSLEIAPSLQLTLSDPGLVADEGVIDLVELAAAADGAQLGDVVGVDLGGPVAASFALTNNLVDIGSPGLDVAGDLSALAGGGSAFSFQASRLGDIDALKTQTPIAVGLHLGDWLSLRDLSPADVLRMLVSATEAIGGLAGADSLAHEIPFTGISVQDMVGFSKKLADVADAVEQRDPETLSAFARALEGALADAGVPDSVDVDISGSGDALLFNVDLSYERTASYPFSLDLKELLPEAAAAAAIVPFDGGARVSATAGVQFQPTIGIRFDDVDLDQRVFVTGDPSFYADLDAEIAGDAYLGPLAINVNGGAEAHPRLDVNLTSVLGSGGRITVASVRDGLSNGLDTGSLLTWGGAFSADMTVGPFPAGSIHIEGDFVDLLGNGSGSVSASSDINFDDITIDLGTLVRGTGQTARFIGRALSSSDALADGLPLVGDELKRLVSVGADLRAFADELDALWDTAETDSEAFVTGLSSQLTSAFCGSLPAGFNCSVELELRDGDGAAVTTVSAAEDVRLVLTLGQHGEQQVPISGGLDLAPVFALGLDSDLTMTYGYQLSAAIGVNISDGFYVTSGDGEPLLELYASVDLDDINVPVEIAGIRAASIVDGSATLGGHNGGLGPDGTAAGFALELSEPLTLGNLSDRRTPADRLVRPRITVDASFDLPVVLAVDGVNEIPRVTFPVHFSWGVDADITSGVALPQPTLTIGTAADPVTVDATSLVQGVLQPAFDMIAENNPINAGPITAALNTNVPLLDSTVRDTISLGLGQSPAWQAFLFFVDLDTMARNFSADGIGGEINLGWVEVLPTFVVHENPDAFDDLGELKVLFDRLSAMIGGPSTYQPASQPSARGFSAQSTGGIGQVVRVPMIEQPLDVLQMVLGGDLSRDVTFIEVVPPTLDIGKSIKFSRTLFSLDIGFIDGHLKVSLDGAVGLTLRVGFGFDSSGLATGEPLNGIYLIDPHEGGRRVPVVALGGRVGAGVDGRFGISVGGIDVASASFNGSGSFSAYAGLNLLDSSPALPAKGRNDGRFHLNEIARVIDAHSLTADSSGSAAVDTAGDFLCIFQPTVQVNAALAFRGQAKALGIKVWSGSFSDSWNLVNLTVSCPLEKQVAKTADGVLVLNAGPVHAADRFDGLGDIDEKFTLTLSGSNIVVSWDGQGTIADRSFPLSEVTSIYGDLGVGDNRVLISDAITVPATIIGGDGDDHIEGGGGQDFIDAAGGDNTVKAGSGDNTLRVGDGANTVTFGPGDDFAESGDGVTTYRFEAEWGSNELVHRGDNAILDFTDAGSALTGASFYGEGEINSAGGSRLVYEVLEVAKVLGSPFADDFLISADTPDGFLIDLDDGADTVTVDATGVHRTVTVTDSGATGSDTLNTVGTLGADTFLLRANPPDGQADVTERDTDTLEAAEAGFVALLGRGTDVERIAYDDSVEDLVIDGVNGANQFVLDDTATRLTVEGGDGGSSFQVGQIFGELRVPDAVAAGDEVRSRGVHGRGPMTLGVSHEATLRGGQGDDRFQVYSNIDSLTLEGISGDNLFVLRAFILEGSVEALGGDGDDRFEYVPNEQIDIDGGDGYNTMALIGTEASDGFVIEHDAVAICPQYPLADVPVWAPVKRLPNGDHDGCGVDATFTRIQEIIVHGLHGNDAFWVRSTGPDTFVRLFGGTDDATFLVGDQGDLSGVQGPVEIDGVADPEFDASVPDPVVLPGEDATAGADPVLADYDNLDGNVVAVDGSAHTSDETGTLTDERVSGLGMGGEVVMGAGEAARTVPGGVAYVRVDDLTVLMGSGEDTFTIESTHTYIDGQDDEVAATTWVEGGGGGDQIAVRSVAGPTTIDGQGGDDVVRAGSTAPATGGVLDGIADTLHVVGADGEDDRLYLDASGSAVTGGHGDVAHVEQGRVTGLSMPGEVTHAEVELLDITLTDGKDVANVSGTSTTTVIHGQDRDDRFFVSDAAAYAATAATPGFLPGTLADIDADLEVDGGSGDNLLMVSDRDSTGAVSEAVLDTGRLEGFAAGTITYDAAGTFAGGVTVWTGSGADEVSVVGARSDGDPTTLAWEGRDEGAPRSITTLNTGGGDDAVDVAVTDAHGLFVLNTGSGEDTVDGAASTLGFVAFGGDGNDAIVTGSGDDLVFGDHGRIEYGSVGSPATLLGDAEVANINDGVARKPALMRSLDISVAGDPGGEGFHNGIDVGDGDDIAWGGPGSDRVQASSGRNALIGDHAEVRRVPASALGQEASTVTTNNGFLDITVLDKGIAYVVDITDLDTGGDDVVLGGAEDDWIFSGRGEDIVNGRDGHDIIWAGDDNDIVWGGEGDDRVYGGNGDNAIDVKKVTFDAGLTTGPSDARWALAWDQFAPGVDSDGDLDTHNGSDLVYGGRGRDVMQADVGGAGQTPGDRLIDWYGPYNLYVVCDGAYGAGRVLRQSNPAMIEALLQLAEADGAYQPRVANSSGWSQLALVTKEFASANRNPKHPDHPGNNAPCG